ncbi:MAG TPA: (d)CMP kinase [Longimicrobiales bacterium]|nr:(d)CMP kinase [Longimicrobiales bacterium]
MIIAIDGPAGSGKSTTAKAVARLLGFRHLDSGAFYRAITYAALQSNLDPQQWDQLTPAALDGLGIDARPAKNGFRLFWSGADLTDAIRLPAVNAHVSQMARVPAVRQWLFGHLRAAARDGDLVADGRDMGTVVFPDAHLKVFLTADPAERAKRRLLEQGVAAPTKSQVEAEKTRLTTRDRIDSDRAVSPLRAAEDAVRLDTTGLSFEEQVDAIVTLARARQAAG